MVKSLCTNRFKIKRISFLSFICNSVTISLFLVVVPHNILYEAMALIRSILELVKGTLLIHTFLVWLQVIVILFSLIALLISQYNIL